MNRELQELFSSLLGIPAEEITPEMLSRLAATTKSEWRKRREYENLIGECSLPGFEEENKPQQRDVIKALQRMREETYRDGSGGIHRARASDDYYVREQSAVHNNITGIPYGEKRKIVPNGKIEDPSNFDLSVDLKTIEEDGDKIADVQQLMSTPGASTCPAWNTTQSLTVYDTAIEEAVGNLVEEGQNIVTASIIYNRMHGRYWHGKPITQEEEDRINASMERLRRTYLYGEYTHNDRRKKEIRNYKFDGAILHANRVEENVEYQHGDGKTVKKTIYWHIICLPSIFEHSELVGRIQTIRNSMLAVPGNISMTTVRVRDYMIDEIFRMNGNQKKQKPRMLWNTMAAALGVSGMENRMAKRRMKQYAKRILESWLKSGDIQAYSVDDDGINLTPGAKLKLDIPEK